MGFLTVISTALLVLHCKSLELQPPVHFDDQSINLLWNGMDLPAFDMPVHATTFLAKHMSQQPAIRKPSFCDLGDGVPSPNKRAIHIFGLQNTGTNLLLSMLIQNFGYGNDNQDGALEIYDATDDLFHGFWKHASVELVGERFPECLSLLASRAVIPLVMVRNPMSWLQSMRKAPYEMCNCTIGDDWLNKECWHQVPDGNSTCAIKCWNSTQPSTRYPRLQSVWSSWMSGYHAFSRFGLPDPLFVHYEDLVQDPVAIMTQIAARLNLTLPSEVIIMEGPAKTHGFSSGREEALDKITSRGYMNMYSTTEQLQACASLDQGVMQRHLYDDCKATNSHS